MSLDTCALGTVKTGRCGRRDVSRSDRDVGSDPEDTVPSRDLGDLRKGNGGGRCGSQGNPEDR